MLEKNVSVWLLAMAVSGCGVATKAKQQAPKDTDSASTVTEVPTETQKTAVVEDDKSDKGLEEEPCAFWCQQELKAHSVCSMPAGAPPKLDKIVDLVALLNLLPRPVSLACLFDVLPKPIELTATTGPISVQPAFNASNPRIFVFVGSMILAVVPDGPNRELLEMSEVLSPTESIKGELTFPLKDTLVATAPYDQILRSNGDAGTRCAACHQNEKLQPGAAYGGKAYVSEAVRSVDSEVVSITILRKLGDACKDDSAARCDLLRALLGSKPADNQERLFPPTMPTMF